MLKVFDSIENLQPEVDYQALMAQLHHHSHPRRKLQELQRKGLLIRLKKGFYVLSKEVTGRIYCPQIVANLLYGPSYISLEFALSFYQLIPERVETVTSVSTQKNKLFKTAAGSFSYQHLSKSIYPVGITLQSTMDNRNYLIATPEKALMDLFSLRFSNSDLPTKKSVKLAIEEDLRIDLFKLKALFRKDQILMLKPYYKRRPWNKMVLEYVQEML